jgi:bifunctional enzyme CysN/CysC
MAAPQAEHTTAPAPAAPAAAPPPELPTMNVVVVGHVDHGKSTVVGRLLHDTGVLPHGKIEQVRSNCERSGKPFEYAFLIDALQDEQAQGITIDAARVFFRSEKRRYIIIDAPGHIEFLKNMISGAARAEAAILVIDASEGVRENSRRHGYMAAMLGIRQLLVVVNKMDLVDYDEATFTAIRDEYETFLREIQVEPRGFIPVSGRHGDNLVGGRGASERTPWYDGPALLEQIDAFTSAGVETAQALRLPVQDVYKFPTRGDDARIIAGTVATGSVQVGDVVEFLPSRKRARVRSVEGFQVASREQAAAGMATGVTLSEELYVRPGELMYRVGEQAPRVGTTFRCNLFWLGRNPLVPGKRYRLKLATTRVAVHVKEIVQVMDAATLEHSESAAHKAHVGRHEVAECVLETHTPIAFDLGLGAEFAATGRFVLVDEYEIAGGGIVTEYLSGLKASLREHVKQRDYAWVRGAITHEQRIERYKQRPRLVVLTGENREMLHGLARDLEARLFDAGGSAYYLGLTNLARGLDATMDEAAARAAAHADEDRGEHLRRLGEVAHILGDAGQIVITTVTGLDAAEAEVLRILNEPNDMLVIRLGADYHAVNADLVLAPDTLPDRAVAEAFRLLREREVVLEYYL